ncbi:hypothetical protein [Streptomyces shenzhenensis]|uniref:hypothetical protein n=1 Tax=Streptomyces shenzhenensis TaxID=943815 RepID=UPI001F188FAF|nr:hypothetical protein [Streptomyces shenzhenensis]
MTLRELVTVCRSGAEPWRQELLVAGLRRAGCLSSADDLGRLFASGDPRLDMSIDDHVAARLLETSARVRFWPRAGYLWATQSDAAPLSAAGAFRRYGIGLMVAALDDSHSRAQMPGRAGRRLLVRLWQRLWFLFMPILGPALVVALVRRAVAGREGLVPLIEAAVPSAVFAAVTWTWLALRLPPEGLVARWTVALLVAGSVGFLVLVPWCAFVALAAGARARGRNRRTSGT